MSYIDEKNVALLVLAFPELSDKDKIWIDDFRKKYDKLFYGTVDPHFTFVFPTFGISTTDFISEIQSKSEGINSFKFKVKCAMMNNDSLSDYYHIFLIPDEGNSNIVKAHDLLYSGILGSTQMLDVDFISHIGIGNSESSEECKTLVEQINNENLCIEGQVNELSIISFGDSKVELLERIRL